MRPLRMCLASSWTTAVEVPAGASASLCDTDGLDFNDPAKRSAVWFVLTGGRGGRGRVALRYRRLRFQRLGKDVGGLLGAHERACDDVIDRNTDGVERF